mmetsp:Transcript_36943/g.119160  ORF Transcript_36943/g.119160 Transcript_36943/m.119160 type:complete len:513 (-) Transcript_36943:27-1565(-)
MGNVHWGCTWRSGWMSVLLGPTRAAALAKTRRHGPPQGPERRGLCSGPFHRRLVAASGRGLHLQLPQRAHLPQSLHLPDHVRDGLVDLGLRGEAADAEAQRRVRKLFVHADGAQHVGGLEGGARASRAAGDGRALREGHEQALALDAGEGQVDVADIALRRGTVQDDRRQDLGHAVVHPPVQALYVTLVMLHLLHSHLGGLAEADDDGRRQCTAAHAALLAPAVDDRAQADAGLAPDVEGADALGAVHLVGRDGQQGDVHLGHVDRDLADALGAVGVEEDTFVLADLANLIDRLQDTDLVVHVHDGDQRGVWADRLLQLLQVDDAVGAHGQVCHIPSVLHLQAAAGGEHALVLRLRGDDVLLLAAVEGGHALDSHVVGLGGPGGEEDLLGVRVDELRDLLAGLLCSILCIPAVGMAAAVRVAEAASEPRHHRVQHPGVDGSCGLHVQVGRPPVFVDGPQQGARHPRGSRRRANPGHGPDGGRHMAAPDKRQHAEKSPYQQGRELRQPGGNRT